MKKLVLFSVILFVSVLCTACINNIAIQELNNKAKGYLDKGDNDNAICRLESSVDLDGNILETRYNLGVAYINAEKYDKAESHLLSAIKIKPDFADSYYSLAIAQENIGFSLLEPKKECEEDGVECEDVEVEVTDEADENGVKNVTLAIARSFVEKENQAIASYKKYLEISKDPNNQEILNQIETLEKTVQNYSEKYNLTQAIE